MSAGRMTVRRGGFSMIEMLLVLVLGMMLLGAAFETMARQEQAYGLFSAVAGTQADTRLGVELLTAELREVSANGSDLWLATPDSLKFRALRKFGLICFTNKSNTQLTVAQIGEEPFASGDSIVIYVDQDSLQAKDDIWQFSSVSQITSTSTCGTLLGGTLGVLMPDAELTILKVGGGLRFDSIYPGAPVRSFENLTYRVGEWQGEKVLQRVHKGDAAPMFGPLTETDGFVISYFDTLGTELTTFPLSAADRRSVRRLRIELRAERRAGAPGRTYRDSLITEIYLRGS